MLYKIIVIKKTRLYIGIVCSEHTNFLAVLNTSPELTKNKATILFHGGNSVSCIWVVSGRNTPKEI